MRTMFMCLVAAMISRGALAQNVDRYQTPLPKGAIARLGMLRESGNATTLHSSALTPNEKTLAVPTGGEILLWDLSSGRLLKRLKLTTHEVYNRGCVFRDNDTLLVQAYDSTTFRDNVQTWDIREGKKIASFQIDDAQRSGAFSPDGSLFAYHYVDVVMVHDTKSGKKLFSEKAPISTRFFSPRGDYLICTDYRRGGLNDFTIVLIRDARTGAVRRRLDFKSASIGFTDMSPDGKLLAGVMFVPNAVQSKQRHCLQLFDAATGAVVRTLLETQFGDGGRFSHDGKLLAGMDHNQRRLALWEVETGRRVKTFHNDREYRNFPIFTRDSKTLINTTWFSRVFVHDLTTFATRDLNPTHIGQITSLAFSRDGKRLAAGSNMSEVLCWDVATALPAVRMSMSSPSALGEKADFITVQRLAFAPDNRHLLAQSYIDPVCLFDTKRGVAVPEFRLAGSVYAFSQNGEHLLWLGREWASYNPDWQSPATYSPDDPIRQFNAWRWSAFAFAMPALRQFRCVAYHTPTPTIDTTAKRPIDIFGGGAGEIATVPSSISPDGSLVVELRSTLSGNPSTGRGMYWVQSGVRFVDSITRQEVAVSSDLLPGSVRFAPDSRSYFRDTYEPNGERFATELCETRSMKSRGVKIAMNRGEYLRVCFSHDGRFTAMVSDKNSVELFDLARGKIVGTFDASDRPLVLAFSHDDKTLAVGGASATILLCDISSHHKLGDDPVWPDSDRDNLWRDLADTDASKAFAAMCRLRLHPQRAIPLLRDRVLVRPDPAQVKTWLKQLASPDFALRTKASASLAQLGERARPMLVAALTNADSLELTRRIEALLGGMAVPFSTPVGLRMLRAVEVLDAIRTTEATALLRDLADGGHQDDPLHREIVRALSRR